MSEVKVSLVVITKNESAHIERCLKSVPWVAEMVVLDSKSSDDTVARAQAVGARTFVEDFRGFRDQKARAVSLASHDWVLALDADEALSNELSEELKQIVGRIRNGEDAIAAVRIPRKSFHLGRWILHGGWYPDFQTRFFHRQKATWVGGEVHERVDVRSGVILEAKHPIEHFVFEDLTDQVETNNLYSSKGSLDLIRSGKRFSLWKLVFKPWGKFFETYLWKQGFRDGLPGFIIAVSAAYSLFLKFAKQWEYEVRSASKRGTS